MSNQVKYGDIGPKIRHDRKELDSVMVDGQPRTQVKHKPPIETYYNRKQIDIAERAAGEAIYRYFTNGFVGQNSCEYREPVQGGGISTATHRQTDAQQQFKKGMKAIEHDKDLVHLIRKVCIDECFITELYKHWYAKKKAKAKLRQGLQIIAKVYHYA